MRAVDVGCGPGFLVQALQARGIQSEGLDVSPYALSIAPEEVKDKVHLWDVGFVNDSFFGREVFDLAVSTETFEHILPENASRAVENFWNLLKPGGVAVLTICVTGRDENDPTHVNVVPRSYWEERFVRQGFIEDLELEAELKRFHILETHGGVFALRKPR
jgi:SAM-dependent methyltransferase